MNNRLYLVTGAAGHLGNVLIGKLLRRGEKVRGLMLPGDHSVRFDNQIEVVRGDVRDRASLEALFKNPERRELILIHTAGIVSIATGYHQNIWDVNVTGTQNIVDLCMERQVSKLVYISSVHAIPVPAEGGRVREASSFRPEAVEGLYARTKAAATQYVLDKGKEGLDVSVLHPSGIIGPGDFSRSHLTQLIVDYMNGSLTACVKGGYDFVDVRDVAGGALSCAKQGTPGECYILSGHYCEIERLLGILHSLTGRRAIRTVLPTWFAKGAAPLSELYYKLRKQPPLYTAYSISTLQNGAAFSCEKAAEALGYAPRPLEDTLRDTVDWLMRQGRIQRKGSLFASDH